MGSNGLTSARHDVFAKTLAVKYPESFDPSVPEELVYSGKYQLTDIEPQTGLTVGQLVLSPTRTYAPVVKAVLDAIPRSGTFVCARVCVCACARACVALSLNPSFLDTQLTSVRGPSDIHGMVHCSGGAQSKVGHFLVDGLRVIKDNMFAVPPLFQLIQECSGTEWSEM